MTVCFLCDRELEPTTSPDVFQHPPAEDCLVEWTDRYGVACDAAPDTLFEKPVTYEVSPDDEDVLVRQYIPVDVALVTIFEAKGLARLGGPSTGSGWSSFALYQKCPYAWKKRYLDQAPTGINGAFGIESPSLAVGTLVHVFLAIHYAHMIEGSPYRAITNDELLEHLRVGCNPELVVEGWRLYQAYRLFYQYENIVPLAVEYDLKDPRTNRSCRFDLIAYFPDEAPGRLPGTYIVEHKSASRFDYATLNGWPNDGEILGEVAWYKQLRLEKRFGELAGIIVNIIGKQKDPQFYRAIISPTSWQLEDHLRDLERWDGKIRLAIATDVFERSRSSCVGRYGMCQHFDECASGPNK